MAEVPLFETQNAEDVNQTMDLDEVPSGYNDKIEILKGYERNLSAATYCLHKEDHTLGNVLRYMLMKNEKGPHQSSSSNVQYCGYSNPHPSEPKIHLRIQMFDGHSSLEALKEALNNLEELFDTIGTSYAADLAKEEYEKFEERGANEDELRAIVQRGDEIKQTQRAEREARKRTIQQ